MTRQTFHGRRPRGYRTAARGFAARGFAALALVAVPILAVAQPGQLLQAAASPDPCTGWTTRTIVSGLGVLEDIEPDRTGGMLLAAVNQSAVERLTPGGTTSTVATGLSSPGGERVVGGVLFVNTGDSATSGTTETHDGTIQRIDLSTGARTTYASGLVMPNGLVLGPDGAAYTTRDDLNADSAITRVDSSDPGHPNLSWAKLGDTNGVSIDPTGTWLYADITFQAQSDVYRIRLSNPTDIELVASLADVGVPAIKGLDDLTIDATGVLYITANGSGEVIRLDPATGAHCVIVSGLQNPSALKFGQGPGWTSSHLYLVGFDGAVRELTPPAGVSPQPEPDLLTLPPGGGPTVPDLQPALATAAVALAILAATLLRRRSEPDA